MTKAEYLAYLQTRQWEMIAEAAKQAANYECALCMSDAHLNVHHRTYDRVGAELPTDLVVLCGACHKRHHRVLQFSASLLPQGRSKPPHRRVLCAIARVVIEEDPSIDDAEWKETIKRRLVTQGWQYPDPEDLGIAITAVERAINKQWAR